MTASILPFPNRPLPGIRRPQRVSVSSLTGLSRDLDELARAAERVANWRGCTGAPDLEAAALDIAFPTREVAERLSLACVAEAYAVNVERESA